MRQLSTFPTVNPLAMPITGGASIEAYANTVHQIPVLEAEEEAALAERMISEKDIYAAQQLVLHNLRFVLHIARGYKGYGLPLGDLVQEGNIGLMKAVKRYDNTRGVRLVAFAVHWIKAEIHEFILKNWRIVKVATTKAQRKLFFNLRKKKERLGWFTAAEAETVANELGVKPSEVVEMESRLSGTDIGFDLDGDDDDERHYAPAQYLASNTADPLTELAESSEQEQALQALATALQALDDRSRDIVQRRWLNEDKATLHELAAEYGVSAERIRQIEQAAFKKLGANIQAPS